MAKKRWPKVPHYSVPLYGGSVYLCHSHEVADECREFLGNPRTELSKAAGLAEWMENDKGHALYLVTVADGSPSTLVHELDHVAFFILGRARVPVSDGDPNEAHCYLLESLVEYFLPKLEKKP